MSIVEKLGGVPGKQTIVEALGGIPGRNVISDVAEAGNPDVAFLKPFIEGKNFPQVLVMPECVTKLRGHIIGAGPGIKKVVATNVTEVDSYTFSSCIDLEELELPELETIPSYCFTNASKLKNIYAPKVKSIQQYAFEQSSIEVLDFPSVTYVGKEDADHPYAFDDNFASSSSKNLINTIKLHGVTSIRTRGLRGFNGLHVLELPSLTEVPESALSSNGSIDELVLPEVTRINNNAFYAPYINKIILPKITYIGNAFKEPGSIKAVYLPNTSYTELPYVANGAFTAKANDFSIYVPSNLLSKYKNDYAWSAFINYIKPIEEAP